MKKKSADMQISSETVVKNGDMQLSEIDPFLAKEGKKIVHIDIVDKDLPTLKLDIAKKTAVIKRVDTETEYDDDDFENVKFLIPLTLSHKIFLLFDEPSSGFFARVISIFIMLLIIVSSGAFIMETVPPYRKPPGHSSDPVFSWIEAICIGCFTLEYVARFFTAGAFMHMVEKHSILKRAGVIIGSPLHTRANIDKYLTDVPPLTWRRALSLKFVFASKMLNIIDLLAIVPYYIELMVDDNSGPGLSVFRILRLARVFRVFKLGKYSAGMQTFARVLHKSKQALYLMLFFVGMAVVLFGSMIYFAEAGEYDENTGLYMRPDKTGSNQEESPFTSIPASFWWVIVTTTTVGYGDLYPTSVLGKCIAAVTMQIGILVLALPITIIGSNFALEYDAAENLNELVEVEESNRDSQLNDNNDSRQNNSRHNSHPDGKGLFESDIILTEGTNNNSSILSAMTSSGSSKPASKLLSPMSQVIDGLQADDTNMSRKAKLIHCLAEMKQLCLKAEDILLRKDLPQESSKKAAVVNSASKTM